MSYDVPEQYEAIIQQFAESQKISTEEALHRILEAGLEQCIPPEPHPQVSYVSLFASATGPGTHQTREEVDRYLSVLRGEW